MPQSVCGPDTAKVSPHTRCAITRHTETDRSHAHERGEPRQWFQARLRWALMEEQWGLYRWREAEHIFLSEDRDTAFQEALRIGHAEEHSLIPALDQKNAP
jgi:hypothetical protein